ncbi:TPA: antitoxin of toxin-antitoxin stability system [Citrobacter amalonaticus]|uniref:antitoxin of toxin-antitoxin stability system n=1 Tax=Citrobacter koseri TaxID=545 RepID=UPI003891E16B|nr:antitoxin of toxin-antitoxin stability system [Citrobacter amalonaticus]
MSKIISTTVYTLDELSGTARENARNWYREHALNDDWSQDMYDDFLCICDILGVDIKRYTVPLPSGRNYHRPCIWFSGFSRQGDGACFEGHYRYQPQSARNIRDHAPQDEELHRIADELQATQQRHFWQFQADIQHRGHYYHEYSMDITVTRHNDITQEVSDEAETALSEALYDLAHWLYCQLSAEYNRLMSPAAVDDAILTNDFTFTGSGLRFG